MPTIIHAVMNLPVNAFFATAPILNAAPKLPVSTYLSIAIGVKSKVTILIRTPAIIIIPTLAKAAFKSTAPPGCGTKLSNNPLI